MIVRFVLALILWLSIGVLIAAEGVSQAPPDYSLIVGYGVALVAWIVSYWIRARSATTRRWWWLGGIPEVVLVLLDRRLARAVRGPHAGGRTPEPVDGRREQQDR